MFTSLVQNEFKIDTWNIIYVSPAGRKYKGKLSITNLRLMYKRQPGLSNREFISESLLARETAEYVVEIKKSAIREVLVEKTASAKNAIVVLSDGSRHTFNYGALNIDKVVEAIRSS